MPPPPPKPTGTASPTNTPAKPGTTDDPLIIAGKTYHSRLLVGTGKYQSLEETRQAIEASGAEIVTVAIRRTNIGQNADEPNLLDHISPERYTILPNTAGCFDAESAIRTCQLARELLGGHSLVKLEVLANTENLYPRTSQTIQAAHKLVQDGFQVMVYTTDDPIVARELEDAGCIAIMPLAAPIGSGLGIQNEWSLREIINTIKVPVLVDAGVGTASDATIAMEMGCDGILMNTAIAHARHPILMAKAMKLGIEAGRAAYRAGRMPKRNQAQPSSPTTNISQ
ncbi:MAG: thiazole synthase [Proteobacteria bacterium]|nr:thiazole synthase [Pseudomonadota bacterium]